MKALDQKNGCPEGVGSKCITWTGPNIPCLGILQGDSMTDVACAIATKLCNIEKGLDLSTISLECLIDAADVAPENKNLKTILQLLLDNQCALKDLIDAIDSGGTTNVTLTLNMRCLRILDDFGNEIPQDLNHTLQSIINQVCTNKDNIAANTADIADHEIRITALEDADNSNPEPTVTICLAPGVRTVSSASIITAAAVCDINTNLGVATDIQNAIAKQCEGLKQKIGNPDGFFDTVDTLSKSFSNLWLAYCNLLTRVTLMEENCCAVTCDSVKVGFLIVPNTDGNQVDIKFTDGAGTFIPNGFIDCGSVLKVTDVDGNFLDFPITISQGGTEGLFDLSGLNLNDTLDFNITARLCADGLKCEKCVGRKYKINSGCGVCKIEAGGTTGNITVIYKID